MRCVSTSAERVNTSATDTSTHHHILSAFSLPDQPTSPSDVEHSGDTLILSDSEEEGEQVF